MSKISRIDVFKNTKSQYGVLASFTTSLQQALRRSGISSRTFDILTQSEGTILSHFAKEMPDYTIGFNVIPHHLSFEQLGIPHIALVVDCATHYPELLQCKSAIAAFVEQDSCDLFRLIGHKRVLFFPHAIDEKWLKGRQMPARRDLDIVLCGSYADSELVRGVWKMLFSEYVQEKLCDIAEKAIASASVTHMEMLMDEMEKGGNFADEIKEKKISAFDLMNWMELYMRGVDRLRFLQALQDVDIHIFAGKKDLEQWEQALRGKKRLFFHEEVAYEELADVFARARIVLNSMPTIKKGLHERLLFALSQGASVLNNASDFVCTAFPQRLAVLSVQPPEYDRANELVQEVFQNEEARQEEVRAAQKYIGEGHTFDARVAYLKEMIPQIIQEPLIL